MTVILPPLQDAHRITSRAMDHGLPGHEFLDRKSFRTSLVQLYANGIEEARSKDRSFAALAFAMLAIGRHCDTHDRANWTESWAAPSYPLGYVT